jgi:hypothetical protein
MPIDLEGIAEMGGAAAVELVASTLADHAAKTGNCPNCNAPTIGAYCAVCGQERDTHRRSVWSLLHSLIEELASFDSRILRTARALVFEPGELSLAFQQGRPRRYVPALRLYLFVSLIFFVILSTAGIALMQFEIVANPVKVTRDAQGHYAIPNPAYDASDPDTRTLGKALLISKAKATRPGGVFTYSSKVHFFSRIGAFHSSLPAAARSQLAEDQNEDAFIDEAEVAGKTAKSKADVARAKSVVSWVKKNIYGGIARVAADPAAINGPLTVWIPRLLFLLLPVYALLLAIFYWRKRKQFYLVDHLVFSLNVHTFFFVVLIADIGLVQIMSDDSVAWLTLGALALYIFIAMKRFYKQGWFWTTVKFALVSFIYTIFFLFPALGGAIALSFLGGSVG